MENGYGLRSSLLAFKTKWRKKGQQSVSPRQRLGGRKAMINGLKGQQFVSPRQRLGGQVAINIRPERAKEYK